MLGRNRFLNALETDTWQAFKCDNYPSRENEVKLNTSQLKVGPNSVDVTLGAYIYVLDSRLVDPMDSNSVNWVLRDLRQGVVPLMPGKLYLGIVRERFDCHKPINGKYYVPMYDGRSTTGRLGLYSHVTAGRGDYGFSGAFTLELGTSHDALICVYFGMRVGQVYFQALDEDGVPADYNAAGAYGHGNQLPVLGPNRFF